jgi:hypothetical protein
MQSGGSSARMDMKGGETMLTKKMLEEMPPDTIFTTGVVNEPGLYAEPVRWLAVRGGIADWAIYYHKEESSITYVRDYGDKCFTKEIIKKLVPCDEDAFQAYRY